MAITRSAKANTRTSPLAPTPSQRSSVPPIRRRGQNQRPRAPPQSSSSSVQIHFHQNNQKTFSLFIDENNGEMRITHKSFTSTATSPIKWPTSSVLQGYADEPMELEEDSRASTVTSSVDMEVLTQEKDTSDPLADNLMMSKTTEPLVFPTQEGSLGLEEVLEHGLEAPRETPSENLMTIYPLVPISQPKEGSTSIPKSFGLGEVLEHGLEVSKDLTSSENLMPMEPLVSSNHMKSPVSQPKEGSTSIPKSFDQEEVLEHGLEVSEETPSENLMPMESLVLPTQEGSVALEEVLEHGLEAPRETPSENRMTSKKKEPLVPPIFMDVSPLKEGEEVVELNLLMPPKKRQNAKVSRQEIQNSLNKYAGIHLHPTRILTNNDQKPKKLTRNVSFIKVQIGSSKPKELEEVLKNTSFIVHIKKNLPGFRCVVSNSFRPKDLYMFAFGFEASCFIAAAHNLPDITNDNKYIYPTGKQKIAISELKTSEYQDSYEYAKETMSRKSWKIITYKNEIF